MTGDSQEGRNHTHSFRPHF